VSNPYQNRNLSGAYVRAQAITETLQKKQNWQHAKCYEAYDNTAVYPEYVIIIHFL